MATIDRGRGQVLLLICEKERNEIWCEKTFIYAIPLCSIKNISVIYYFHCIVFIPFQMFVNIELSCYGNGDIFPQISLLMSFRTQYYCYLLSTNLTV